MYKLNRISYRACYTMQEAGALIGRSERTIRAFVADGLKTIDDGKPTLIRGYDLIEFLRNKNKVTRNPLKDNEIFCLRCREPIVPRDNRVKIQENGTGLKVSCICPECGKVANRAYKNSAKEMISHIFTIVEVLSISDSSTAPVSCPISEPQKIVEPTSEKEAQLCFSL